MKRIFSICLVSFFFLSLITSSGLSQTAQEILEKMIEAQGGRKKLESIKDSTISGFMDMIKMGASGSVTIYQKEPNKMRIDIEMMGMTITQAYDGEKAWMTNPQTGSPMDMPEKFTKHFKRQALGIDSLLNPEKYDITYADKGKESIEGKDYLVLEQTYPDGYKSTLYIDPETYLPYKSKGIGLNQMGVEVETETYLSDYKEIDGFIVPHSIKNFQEGEKASEIIITEVSLNSDLEESLFKMSE